MADYTVFTNLKATGEIAAGGDLTVSDDLLSARFRNRIRRITRGA